MGSRTELIAGNPTRSYETENHVDTDIGTDIDDAVVLALAYRSPEIEILGVTTVYADVLVRARIARKLLEIDARSDIRVYAGTRLPLLMSLEPDWSGFEGNGLLENDGGDG